jgi:LPXTG-site transpeptidase (sortase) family protein
MEDGEILTIFNRCDIIKLRLYIVYMDFFKRILKQFHRRPLVFSTLWIFVFGVFFVGFFQNGWVPPLFRVDTPKDTSFREGPLVEASETHHAVLPVTRESAPLRVVAEHVGLDVVIRNPETRDIDVLNSELVYGAVHYPGSGNLDDTSNLFIFGHSTNWPIVQNQSYKAFNGLKNLEVGELITVYSATHLYTYRVTSVELVDARDAWVQFESTTKKLTLSTCNTFGEVQDRYVVQADFVQRQTL